jgi:hypothetical protein
MDEEKKQVTAQEAPEAPETDIPEETQDAKQAKTDTPPSSEVDVEQEVASEDTQAGTPDTSKWENEKRSMAEKIKALENEKNEYLQAKQLVEALDSAAANDPEFMKLANKKLVEQGLLDESVLQQLESQPQTQQRTDGTADNPVLEWAQNKMQEEKQKREKFFIDFEGRHPDVSEGKPEVVRANRSAISAAAARRMAEGGVSQDEAFEFAYKQIMNPQSLRDEGKLEGLAQAQSSSPAESSASGGSANSSGKVKLTPEQQEMARRFGITEEAYAKRLAEE